MTTRKRRKRRRRERKRKGRRRLTITKFNESGLLEKCSLMQSNVLVIPLKEMTLQLIISAFN